MRETLGAPYCERRDASTNIGRTSPEPLQACPVQPLGDAERADEVDLARVHRRVYLHLRLADQSLIGLVQSCMFTLRDSSIGGTDPG